MDAKRRTGATTRRNLLKAGIGLGAAMSAGSLGVHAPAVARTGINLPRAPNLVVLMTDQERFHMHWPEGWAEANLPSFGRLKRNGLFFRRAYTAACECSPSRAVQLTSRFAPINRVGRTLLWPGLAHKNQAPNVGSLLRDLAGYEVVWKGKWHLSYATNAAPGNGGDDWEPVDIAMMERNFGWSGWNPPDAGNAIQEWQGNQFGGFDGLATLGGGNPDNDGRYIHGLKPDDPGETPGVPGGEGVIPFLRNRAGTLDRPFCLFVSLVNPHDIGAYPDGWDVAGYKRDDFADLGIGLPPNHDDDLSRKPGVQKAARDAYDKQAPLADAAARGDYVNFYAYLHKVVDAHITAVLDALEETGLADSTIVVRLADHGELGLSHGMREKSYTAYEEMIHIPLIVHNPRLFAEPLETDAFYDHLDLLPTLLDLAGVSDAHRYGQGRSIVPVLEDPSASVRDHTLFSYDDVFFLPANAPGGRIRAVCEGDWTYAVYFSLDGTSIEYELYDNAGDAGQMDNLLFENPSAEARREWRRLHRLLTDRFVAAGNLPDAFPWPVEPAAA